MVIIAYVQGLIYFIALATLIVAVLCNIKKIWQRLKLIPIWLWILNFAVLIYKFFYPRIITYKGDYGVTILSEAKSSSWIDAFTSARAAIHQVFIKLMALITGTSDYNAIVNLHILFIFASVLLIYFIIWRITDSKVAASIGGVLFITNPTIFIASLTENYTNLAILFVLMTFFFAVEFTHSKNKQWLYLSFLCAVLVTGVKAEFIIFAAIYLLFLCLFTNKEKFKLISLYFITIISRFIVSANDYVASSRWDTALHGNLAKEGQSFFGLIFGHIELFYNNLLNNVLVFTNIYTLSGLLLIFSVAVIFFNKSKKETKWFNFWLFYLALFSLYYCIMHADGFFADIYKYFPIVVPPLIIFSAYSLAKIVKINKYIQFLVWLIIVGNIFYAYIFTRPYYENLYKEDYYSAQVMLNSPERKEYMAWINNRNRIDDVDYYFVNGSVSMIYAATHIDPVKIYAVRNKQEYEKIFENIPSNTRLYLSQGIVGFNYNDPIEKNPAIDPGEFKNLINDIDVEEELFSYSEEGHEIFLLSARKL